MAEIFQAEGYATFCAGKWHLAPMENCSSAGPFDQWPLGRGFDRFYGFLEGETDQFHPDLVRDNHSVQPPGKPEDGYHLSEDIVDNLLRKVIRAGSLGVHPWPLAYGVETFQDFNGVCVVCAGSHLGRPYQGS